MKSSIIIRNKISNFKKNLSMPGDKSISIRLILLASLAIGKSKIYNLLESEDVINTLKSMKSLGVNINKIKNYYEINGVSIKGLNLKKKTKINAGNSGTFARLFCGLVARSNKKINLYGDKSLSKRDFSRVINPLKLFGMKFKSSNNKLPIIISGTEFLRPVIFEEKKGSAQVKSALMLAALNTPGETKIISVPSRNHTENIFKHCLNIPIKILKKKSKEIIKVSGLKQFKSFDYKVPGDISSASFFIVLTILSKNSTLKIRNVNLNKTRTGIIEILKKMNAKINIINTKLYNGEFVGDLIVKSTKSLKSINCPKSLNTRSIDEFLIIFLICAKAKGLSKFKGIGELRNKESDRLKVASNFLKMIGVQIKESKDGLMIYGNPNLELNGNYVIKDYLKDHRVFMMSCVAALTLGGNFTIKDRDSIKTSFPNFLNILENLGAKIQ